MHELSKNGGGADNIFAETGVAPDPPKAPMAHHPHHPGLKPHAMTAAEYEAKLGKDIHGNPLPKPKGKKAREGGMGEQERAVRQAQAAAKDGGALATGWEKRFDASKGKHFYVNAARHAVTWKRSVAEREGAQVAEVPLAAGWEKKFDASKGKTFYVNSAKHAITWKRPTTSEVQGSSPDAKVDARLARDLVHQPHFKNPNARNPTYEGSGEELNEALSYNKRAVEGAKKYYARIAERRNLEHGHTMSAKRSTLTKLGSRAFFKFDPVKGSFYKYSPDIGAVAKPGSIADTLAKVAASAKTPTITVSSGPALPNGDIRAAARAVPKKAQQRKQRFTQKAQTKPMTKSIDIHETPEYKAAAAKQNSALMNVARTVAMNAGYKPAAHGKKAKAPEHKAETKKGRTGSKGKSGSKGEAARQDQEAVSDDASKRAAAAGDVVAGRSLDPDWQARRYLCCTLVAAESMAAVFSRTLPARPCALFFSLLGPNGEKLVRVQWTQR